MSFLHLSLLAGLAAITVPIMLHLFGQKQPQLIDFPALRFVQETTQEQGSSWQLRHFLLLLLRILLLAALALALARPRVHSAMLGSMLGISAIGVGAALASLVAAVAVTSRRPASVWLTSTLVAIGLWSSAALWGYQSITTGPAVPSSNQSAPVAAALIVDNGPSMAYRARNEVRLDSAKNMTLWILEQLPIDSQVGVLTGAPLGALTLDPATAKTQVKMIELRGAHVDLLSRIRTALDLVLASELERKEIYVITDLMSSSWAMSQAELASMLKEHADEVLVQVIDVGGDESANWQLGDAKPDLETVPAGGDALVEIRVTRPETSTDSRSVTVELHQEDIDPRLPLISNGQLKTPPSRIVDRQVVDLSGRSSETIELSAPGLQPGTHHFTIRLDRPDPLMIDNERYLSIVAQSQRPTLIVATDPELGRMLRLVVDPSTPVDSQTDQPVAKQVRYAQLSQVQLEDFAVVCLFDPPPLSAKIAGELNEHVLGGGGLLTILGPSLEASDLMPDQPIASLLPGEIDTLLQRGRSQRDVFLEPVAPSHPVFDVLGEVGDEVPWNRFPVFRSWLYRSLAEDAQILMKLTNHASPALAAQNRGRGQIITLSTPIPEVESRDRELWNELWIGEDPWPAYALLYGALRTLSGADQAAMNYQVDDLVSLPNDSLSWPSRYVLYEPNIQSRAVDARDGNLNLGRFEQAGIYRLRGQSAQPVARGFSVNVPAADTQLQRLTSEQLDEQLGAGNYRLARERSEVESSVGQARFGRELYPLLMVFVAGLFLAEQAMSNRFYQLKFSRTKGLVA